MAGVKTDVEDRQGGRVAWVRIDNPAKLNCLNSAVMNAFVEAFEALNRDDGVRAAVVTGVGDKAFAGGADVVEMAGLDADTARAFITRVHHCCDVVRRAPFPVIARIQGYCLGAGLELAASCDLRVVAEEAVLGMPEVKLGVPSVVEAALLPRLVGWGRASEILLLGETFSAAQAAAWGLAEAVAPLASLDREVERRLDAILVAGPHAVRAQKALMRAWESLPLDDAIAAGVEAFAEAWKRDEPAKAMAAFLAERGKPPRP